MNPSLGNANDAVRAGLESIGDRAEATLAAVKPRLRGWLHLATAPIALAGGIVLIVLSPTATTRLGSAVFAASALLLFGVSAVYHTGTWSPKVWAFLRRFDHANIFLLIAGSYTPLTLLLLEGRQRTVLLTTVWTCAVLGVLFRVLWTDAPRWLYTPIYIGMGWAALFFMPGFLDGAEKVLGNGTGVAVLGLIAAGGLLYTLGVGFYANKKLRFRRAIWHGHVVAAASVHWVAVLLAVLEQPGV